jgi:hypothetical protein
MGERSTEVVGGSASVFAGEPVARLVDLSESAFDERRRRAEERDRPHPEQRSRTTEGDRGRNTSDIARPNPARQRHCQRLKRRDTRRRLLALEHQPDHFAKLANLHEL